MKIKDGLQWLHISTQIFTYSLSNKLYLKLKRISMTNIESNYISLAQRPVSYTM